MKSQKQHVLNMNKSREVTLFCSFNKRADRVTPPHNIIFFFTQKYREQQHSNHEVYM